MAKKKESPKKAKSDVKSKPKATGYFKKIGKGVVISLGSILILLLVAVIIYFTYEYTYQNKLYPRQSFGGKSVSGKSYAELADEIKTYKTDLQAKGLIFIFQDHTYTINTTSTDTTDSTKTVLLADVNIDDTAQAAYALGRGTDSWSNLKTQAQLLLNGQTVNVHYTLDQDTIKALLDSEFSSYTTTYQNATLTYADDGTVQINDHKDGTTFAWDQVLQTIQQQLAWGQPVKVSLTLTTNPAPITIATAKQYQPEAEKLATLAPITLTYEDKKYEITRQQFEQWLTLTAQGMGFDHDTSANDLSSVASNVAVPVQEGRFSLDLSNKQPVLQQFESGQAGLEVNVNRTIATLEQAVLKERQNTAELVVVVTKPRATPDNLDNLGITELLGTGETNFAGSPNNRIYNIHKGADMLNGLLIAPDETFSLLSILSPIDEAHGWKPELVIKDNKLKKEAGGGLCQVGTTSFRAAMLSGLPVVERRNHTWAVSYYNYNGKAGVDATIYEPSPDFKFKNDTGHYILWRSRIEGTKLMFELWGTSDERKGYFTEPVNYNYISPGSVKETIDPSLPPGTRNCDAHVFTGVSASFDYYIERPDGTKEKTTFTSVYKPQAATCIVGPSAAPATTNSNTNSATNSNMNITNTNKTNTNTNKNSNSNTNKKS